MLRHGEVSVCGYLEVKLVCPGGTGWGWARGTPIFAPGYTTDLPEISPPPIAQPRPQCPPVRSAPRSS